MSDGSGRICRTVLELNPGLYVILFKGLDGCCENEVAPDAGCRENGPEEVSGERAGGWDYKMTCNICQFMGLTPLSLFLIGLYAG